MALQKITVIDKIEVLELGHIQVREATYVEEDGVRISAPTYYRYAFRPGDDVSGQDERVRNIASTVWTPGVIASDRDRRSRALEEG